jgi:hypothetical protein
MARSEGNWFTGTTGLSDFTPTMLEFRRPEDFQLKQYDLYAQKDPLAQQAQSFGQQLQQQSQGTMLSEYARKRNLDDLMRQVRSQAATQSGVNPATAARLAGQNMSQMSLGFNQQNQEQRLREQMANQQLYGQWLGGQQGMQQEASRANLQGMMGKYQLEAGQYNLMNQLKMQQDLANAGNLNSAGFIGGLAGGIGRVAGAAASYGG